MAPESGQIIARDQWQTFFADLQDRYRGYAGTITRRRPAADEQVIARDQPFERASLRTAGATELRIRLTGSEHTIRDLREVSRLARADGGPQVTVATVGGESFRLQLADPDRRGVDRGAIAGAAPVAPAMRDPAADLGEPDGERRARHRDSPGAGGGRAGTGSSSGAAGGSVAGPPQPAGNIRPGSDVRPDSSDDMGGVAGPGGGSLGERDLSGRPGYRIAGDTYGDTDPDSPDLAGAEFPQVGPGSDTGAPGKRAVGQGAASPAASGEGNRGAGASDRGVGGAPDLVDAGRGQGVVDTGIDPVAGGPIDPGDEADEGSVEGEVGAQAERDLSEMLGERERQRRRPGAKGRKE